MSVLAKIFATKADEVAAAKRAVPPNELERMAADAPAPRGFTRALQRAEGLALIAEVKRASPSMGLIRADFDPVAIAQTYVEAGAAAISVLTDVPYFQGSPDYLRQIRAAVPVPCLRKDFIADPYQVWEARAWGADAVLLIAAWLDDAALRDLRELAESLGMDALVEVHTAEETMAAISSGASLIGVNNRNLADFSTDLATSERLIPLITPYGLAVSESALASRADLDRVEAAGAKAVLIGTTFTAAPDIAAKVRQVMRGPA
ncbi:MAG: indole-3-glycerol phosphate synthase TrpC [Fimbriimonadaceae bacterium]|nr:indole-3-glycerol phosphate synthase TrpC [Fimbriimonadaceae bacterium]